MKINLGDFLDLPERTFADMTVKTHVRNEYVNEVLTIVDLYRTEIMHSQSVDMVNGDINEFDLMRWSSYFLALHKRIEHKLNEIEQEKK